MNTNKTFVTLIFIVVTLIIAYKFILLKAFPKKMVKRQFSSKAFGISYGDLNRSTKALVIYIVFSCFYIFFLFGIFVDSIHGTTDIVSEKTSFLASFAVLIIYLYFFVGLKRKSGDDFTLKDILPISKEETALRATVIDVTFVVIGAIGVLIAFIYPSSNEYVIGAKGTILFIFSFMVWSLVSQRKTFIEKTIKFIGEAYLLGIYFSLFLKLLGISFWGSETHAIDIENSLASLGVMRILGSNFSYGVFIPLIIISAFYFSYKKYLNSVYPEKC